MEYKWTVSNGKVNYIKMALVDASLTTPFTMTVNGARGCGKTEFTKRLLLDQEKYLDKPFDKVTWVYKHAQPNLFDPLIKKFGNRIELLNEIPNFESLEKQNTVFVFDDMLLEVKDSRDILELFLSGRHIGVSVITLSQNMFISGKYRVSMDRNTDYIVLMNNVRGGSQIATLSHQMNPLTPKFLTSAFKDATTQAYGHLLVDTIKSEWQRLTSISRKHFQYGFCNNLSTQKLIKWIFHHKK